jgi:hypothetical protein
LKKLFALQKRVWTTELPSSITIHLRS